MDIIIQAFIRRTQLDVESEEVVEVSIDDTVLASFLVNYIKSNYGSDTKLDDFVVSSVRVD